jgi:signal transduction histidine kinase
LHATLARRGQYLRGMHERAALRDADLDVRSHHTGTIVRLEVPSPSPARRR